MTYGQMLRAARQSRGFSLECVATELGCSIPYLSDIERDRRSPLSRGRLAPVVALLQLDELAFEIARAVASSEVSLAGLTPAQVERVVRLVERMRSGEPEIRVVSVPDPFGPDFEDEPPSSGRRRLDP